MKRIIHAFAILLLTASSSFSLSISDAYLSWAWNDGVNEHNYYVFNDKQIWDNARQDAFDVTDGLLEIEGYLATITSAGEQSAMVKALNNFGIRGEYWLGGVQDPNSAAAEGWKWDNGELFNYSSWAPNEPNDWGRYDEIHLGTWSNFGWDWNDEHGSANIKGYIVEVGNPAAPVPEPATVLLFGSGLIGLAGIVRRKRK